MNYCGLALLWGQTVSRRTEVVNQTQKHITFTFVYICLKIHNIPKHSIVTYKPSSKQWLAVMRPETCPNSVSLGTSPNAGSHGISQYTSSQYKDNSQLVQCGLFMIDNIYCMYILNTHSTVNKQGYQAAVCSYTIQINCSWSFFPASNSGKQIVKAVGNQPRTFMMVVQKYTVSTSVIIAFRSASELFHCRVYRVLKMAALSLAFTGGQARALGMVSMARSHRAHITVSCSLREWAGRHRPAEGPLLQGHNFCPLHVPHTDVPPLN